MLVCNSDVINRIIDEGLVKRQHVWAAGELTLGLIYSQMVLWF